MSPASAASLLADVAPRPGEPAGTERPWADPNRQPSERVDYLLKHMTVAEKISQLVGLWVGAQSTDAAVAPQQDDMSQDAPVWAEAIAGGLG